MNSMPPCASPRTRGRPAGSSSPLAAVIVPRKKGLIIQQRLAANLQRVESYTMMRLAELERLVQGTERRLGQNLTNEKEVRLAEVSTSQKRHDELLP